MAIVQVSRITHRKGLSENLPQLAGAELGWVIDQRRLYIGNGTLEEGAPVIGNTEILTQYSDILGIASTYTYKGLDAGYTAQTGPDSSDIVRSLQRKLDESVSVRDYGAVGDGVTDDTAAFNRALYDLYCRETNTQIRRQLFVPAGTYLISETLKLPPYSRLFGEGAESSRIKLSFSGSLNSSNQYALRTTDSLQQTGANIGNLGATIPQHIEVASLCIETTNTNVDICLIERAQQIQFHNVNFGGPFTTSGLATAAADVACVRFASTAGSPVRVVAFDMCKFTGMTYAVKTDARIEGVSFENSWFDTLYQGVVMGEAPEGDGPKGIRVMHCLFDNIRNEGVKYDLIEQNITGYNIFEDVGNSFLGSGNPVSPIVYFGADNNLSIGDSFSRNATDALVYPRVETSDKQNVALTTHHLKMGTYHRHPGLTQTLNDNTGATTFFTVTTSQYRAFKMNYTIIRDTAIRHGVLTVVAQDSDDSSLTLSYSEDYDENNPSGITFTASQSGSTVSVKYATSSTGSDASMTYSIEHLA